MILWPHSYDYYRATAITRLFICENFTMKHSSAMTEGAIQRASGGTHEQDERAFWCGEARIQDDH